MERPIARELCRPPPLPACGPSSRTPPCQPRDAKRCRVTHFDNRRRSCVRAANGSDGGGNTDKAPLEKKAGAGEPAPEPAEAATTAPAAAKIQTLRRRSRRSKQTAQKQVGIDDFNPISIGRRSRQIFDDVWLQFQKLSSPLTNSLNLEDEFARMRADNGEFETPQAAVTRVLVAGASGRVGRVLVRKLLLRGYPVTVLARRGRSEDGGAELPSSVEVVVGDVGDPAACRRAIKGVDKVVYCAHARSTDPNDLKRVEERGPYNLATALQDAKNAQAQRQGRRAATSKRVIAERADFQASWAVEHAGPEALERRPGAGRRRRGDAFDSFDVVPDYATTGMNERNNLCFDGEVYSRGGYAQMGAPLDGRGLVGAEGLLLRCAGDGQVYIVMLTTGTGLAYGVRVTADLSFANLRLPFSSFRPVQGRNPPGAPAVVDPAAVTRMSIRFEPRARAMPAIVPWDGDLSGSADIGNVARPFHLELDRIKVLPGGTETDFVLVSCAGRAGADEDDAPAASARGQLAKRRGEAALRNSGLGYTIVRPGPLLEEPGGYRALVFDQGERITQGISCADVADVCLKALHDPAARNKTFEVCYEYTPAAGLEMYELVAHLPDKANNYLGPALASLERNT